MRMSNSKQESVRLVVDGDKVSLAIEATFGSVGAWWIYKRDVVADEYKLIGQGQAEGTALFRISESPSKLIGDKVNVVVLAANLKAEDALVGASVHVKQGTKSLSKLKNRATVKEVYRFDFVVTFERA